MQEMQGGQGFEIHLQTLIIYTSGSNQNFCTFTLILLISIVLCGYFP